MKSESNLTYRSALGRLRASDVLSSSTSAISNSMISCRNLAIPKFNTSVKSTSNVGILRSFLLFLRCSPLSVFGFDRETFHCGFHIEDTCAQRFVQSGRVLCLRQAICQHSRRIEPTRIVSPRSIDFFVAIIAVVPDVLLHG